MLSLKIIKKIKKLHGQKIELQHLKSLCSPIKLFVIEFNCTRMTGKTTPVNNLYDFFKKCNFNVSLI